jgi:hypothetical protein
MNVRQASFIRQDITMLINRAAAAKLGQETIQIIKAGRR